MPFDAHKNLAISSIAIAPSPALSGTVFSVPTGHGTRFAAPPFNATVWPKEMPSIENAEIVRVTAIEGDQLTVIRTAEQPFIARAIQVGDLIVATVTVKMLTDIERATVKTFRQGHTWGVVGDLSALSLLPSMFVPVVAGQVSTVVGLRAKIAAGTSVDVQLKCNGTNMTAVLTVTPTATTFPLSVVLAADDELSLTLASPIGTPRTLSATVLVEHTF